MLILTAEVGSFGERIQPLMQCRTHIPAVTKEVA
jgi:pyrimidine oxygenase